MPPRKAARTTAAVELCHDPPRYTRRKVSVGGLIGVFTLFLTLDRGVRPMNSTAVPASSDTFCREGLELEGWS